MRASEPLSSTSLKVRGVFGKRSDRSFVSAFVRGACIVVGAMRDMLIVSTGVGLFLSGLSFGGFGLIFVSLRAWPRGRGWILKETVPWWDFP